MKQSLTYRRVLDRRTFLRGAGGVAIALPSLEEMVPHSAFAAPGDPPLRFVTVFFGQGLLPSWFKSHFDTAAPKLVPDPLVALDDLRPKVSFYSGLHQSSSGTHAQTGVQCFTGSPGRGSTTSIRAQGPSVDQVVLRAGYPGGRAPTPIQTLAAASFFNTRNYSNQRHTWGPDGEAAAQPYSEAADLFKAVTGFASPSSSPATPSSPAEDPAARKARAYRKSVLDTVVGEYRRWTGEAGGLGPSSRRRLSDHLEELRALELRIAGLSSPVVATAGGAACKPVAGTTPQTLRTATVSGSGTDLVVDPAKWEAQFRALADVYAMALACDVARFGNITFQGAGDHVRFMSPWKYKDTTVDFRDAGESNHLAYYHQTSGNEASGPNTNARKHTFFILAQVEYFLKRLNALPAENGKTLLDASAVLVSTEMGDGGGDHSARNVLHALSAANGRFKTGTHHMFDLHASSFYNAVIHTFGITQAIGAERDPAKRDQVAQIIRA